MIKMTRISLLIIALGATTHASAQTVTWSKDIAPILFNNCTSCHHPGGLAPNALTSYSQAFNYRFMIKNYVDNNIMPPWPPDPHYKRLAHERVISVEDKNKISAWILDGATEGNPSDAPPTPVYGPLTSKLSSVDYTAKMSDYLVNTSGDLYRCFVINTNFATDKFASEIEVVPGNSSIVHHVLVYEDTSQTILQKDAADPGPGYTSFFGTGSDDSQLIGEWVPGTEPIKFPAGMGIKLKKNTRLILQVHYPKGTYLQTDSTRVNIKFANPANFTPFREVLIVAPLNEGNLVNGPLVIPPNVVKTFTAKALATINVPLPNNAFTVLSIAPHMHLIGDKMKVYAIDIESKDTLPLINIPRWDFKWQGIYNFRNPVRIPVGSTLVAESVYDNTSANPENPNSPPQFVTQGEATTDEMMLVFFAFTYYMKGDEKIVVDNSPMVSVDEVQKNVVKTLQLYSVSPNPAKGQTSLRYFSPAREDAVLKIYNIDGKLVSERSISLSEGYGEIDFNLESLTAGQYFINLQTSSVTKTKSFVVYE